MTAVDAHVELGYSERDPDLTPVFADLIVSVEPGDFPRPVVRGTWQIRHRLRQVVARGAINDTVDEEDTRTQDETPPQDPDYYLTCARTGRFFFTVTVTDSYGTTVTRGGSFRVPPCTTWRFIPIRRGDAAARAATDWGDEYVSRSRCERLDRRGKAWRCVVVHNNNIRVCATEVFIRKQTRIELGTRRFRWVEREGRTRCASF